MSEDDAKLVKWLEDAARYFEARDIHGEDNAHWANVFNAETCRKIAARMSQLANPLPIVNSVSRKRKNAAI